MITNVKQRKRYITLFENTEGGVRTEIPITFLEFKDGSVHTLIKDVSAFAMTKEFLISAYLESMNDLMRVAQIVNILKKTTRLHKNHIKLEILSPMYQRYDRHMHEDCSDSLDVVLYAKMIKTSGVDSVTLIDPHSHVFGNALEDLGLPIERVGNGVLEVHNNGCKVIVPDFGALSKAKSKNICVYFDKNRDAKTGKIEGICFGGFLNGFSDSDVQYTSQKFVIADDICERGGTFFGVADAFKEKFGDKDVSLYVTHGIFPHGFDAKRFAETFNIVHVQHMSSQAYSRFKEIENFGGKIFCENVYFRD